jgi:hypothetical protein
MNNLKKDEKRAVLLMRREGPRVLFHFDPNECRFLHRTGSPEPKEN